ncbi:MAG: site-specific DNA-methyltransferase [Bacilli bacterium]|nr:site-specific DNA-methyltransferase [Bacilli bacterium]
MIQKDKIFFKDKNLTLYEGDSFQLLKKIDKKSINMIFADPPYFLSGNGITCNSGTMVSVKKADWDEIISIDEKIKYNRKWLKMCRELLMDSGTIWISGTFHNIYSIGVALELEGFTIINNVTWQKTNPPPNISCRAFTHSTETFIWAKKNRCRHLFNYKIMKEINGGKQMKDVWEFSLTKPSEKKEGKHPTQKPIDLLKRIVLASTNEGDLVLDPFNGSGTTGIACALLNRNYIGIDNSRQYLEISRKRYLKLIEGATNERF